MENINCLKLGGNKMVLTHIHVNARFYILSPDPFVQATEYTQSYNRYSYCWNNPLKYTDPSGYYTINLDGLVFEWHNLSALSLMLGGYNVESIYTRGYNGKAMQFQDLSRTYSYYDAVPKFLRSGESINDYRHTATTHYYKPVDWMDGDDSMESIGSNGNKPAIIYPPKIDFSRSDYLDQMLKTFYWVQTLPLSHSYVLIDDLIDFNSLKESKYFERMYSFPVMGYKSKSEPVVTIQDPGTLLLPEISMLLYGPITVEYDRVNNKVHYHGWGTNSEARMFMGSSSPEGCNNRNSGITIRFNLGEMRQILLFTNFNAQLGGVYVRNR